MATVLSRGSAATALTAIVAGRDHTVVGPSLAIDHHFECAFVGDFAEGYIGDIRERQGLAVTGHSEYKQLRRGESVPG